MCAWASDAVELWVVTVALPRKNAPAMRTITMKLIAICRWVTVTAFESLTAQVLHYEQRAAPAF